MVGRLTLSVYVRCADSTQPPSNGLPVMAGPITSAQQTFSGTVGSPNDWVSITLYSARRLYFLVRFLMSKSKR